MLQVDEASYYGNSSYLHQTTLVLDSTLIGKHSSRQKLLPCAWPFNALSRKKSINAVYCILIHKPAQSIEIVDHRPETNKSFEDVGAQVIFTQVYIFIYILNFKFNVYLVWMSIPEVHIWANMLA